MNAPVIANLSTLRARALSAMPSDYCNPSDSPLFEALTLSIQISDDYVQGRNFTKAGMTKNSIAIIAQTRLEMLLAHGRDSLNGVISDYDFSILCNVFQDEIASPLNITSTATAVASEHALNPETYHGTMFGPLMDKLIALSVLEHFALRDLVERYWYIGINEYSTIREYLEANDISLSEP